MHNRDIFYVTHVLFIHKVSLGVKGPTNLPLSRPKISSVEDSAFFFGDTVMRLVEMYGALANVGKQEVKAKFW